MRNIWTRGWILAGVLVAMGMVSGGRALAQTIPLNTALRGPIATTKDGTTYRMEFTLTATADPKVYDCRVKIFANVTDTYLGDAVHDDPLGELLPAIWKRGQPTAPNLVQINGMFDLKNAQDPPSGPDKTRICELIYISGGKPYMWGKGINGTVREWNRQVFSASGTSTSGTGTIPNSGGGTSPSPTTTAPSNLSDPYDPCMEDPDDMAAFAPIP